MKTNSFVVLTDVRLVRDPEKRQVGDKELLDFTVADNPGDERSATKFIDVTVAGKLVEVFAQLKKGDRVNVAGKETFATYPKKDGGTGFRFKISYPMTVTRVYTDQLTVAEPASVVPSEVTEPPKRGPGRPKKQMPWDAE